MVCYKLVMRKKNSAEMEKKMVQKFQDFIKQKKWRKMKKTDWAALALAGVLILIIAMPDGKKTGAGSAVSPEPSVAERKGTISEEGSGRTADDYAAYLERRLKEVLSQMEGVGEVAVMITVSDSGQHVVEKDRTDTSDTVTETDSSGGSRTSTNQETSVSTVFVESGGDSYPYIGKEVLPTIEGVVVVAEGGENSRTVSNIYDAVQALFSIEAHRIKVVKMGSKEE